MSNVLQNTGGLTLKDRGAPPWGSKALIAPYAIGVPHPEESFGYNPLTKTETTPSEWPTAESVGSYFIDDTDGAATDTANTYGFPDKPRLTVPNAITLSAGKIVKIGGGTGYTTGSTRFNVTASGTQENPCFILGEGSDLLKELRLNTSTHCIVDNLGFSVSGQTFNIGSFGANPCQFITLRNSALVGPGTADGNKSAVSMAGNVTTRTENIVVYNNTITDWGDSGSASENDYHGILPDEYCSNIWIIGGVGARNGGDSVQVGQASYTGSQRPDHVYISKNDFSFDRENAIDVKSSTDVIYTENSIHDYSVTGSSAGEGVIIHDSCERVWGLNNVIYNVAYGIIGTAGVDIYALGNEVRDTTGTVVYATPYFDPNCAIQITGAGPFGVSHNTYNNCIMGFQATGGSTELGSQVSGNISANRQDASNGWDFMVESTGDAPDLVADYNCYDDFRGRIGSNDYTSLAAWRVATVYDDNAVEGDPMFTNAAANIFTLESGSDFIDVVAVEHAAYATFESTYGINIRFDINGNAKPSTNADAGAYQRVA